MAWVDYKLLLIHSVLCQKNQRTETSIKEEETVHKSALLAHVHTFTLMETNTCIQTLHVQNML
jgi:hypothetical protein